MIHYSGSKERGEEQNPVGSDNILPSTGSIKEDNGEVMTRPTFMDGFETSSHL